MTKSELRALAAQAAQAAPVRKIATGETALDYSARDWRQATRGETPRMSSDQREDTMRQNAYENMLRRQGVV